MIFYADVNTSIIGEIVRTIEKRPEALLDYLEDTGLDERIILIWIFRKWKVGH